MSHSSITAHETPQMRHVSRKWIEIAVAVVALGAAFVFVISQSDTAADQTDAPVAAATGLATEDFLRLNTTDLEYLSPAISDVPGTASAVAAESHFMTMNVGSYDGLNSVHEARYAVDPHFKTINEEFHDWPGESTLQVGQITEPLQQPGGPR